MKKKIAFCALALMCIFCLPIFTGCFGEGSKELTGLRFTQEIYELDVDVPTKIEYKVYPSTAALTNITYDVSGVGVSQEMYNYVNGVFTIRPNRGFPASGVTVTISYLDKFKDTCIVKQKQYPTELSFSQTEVSINSGFAQKLNLLGKFDGASDMQQIDDSKYNLQVVSDNPRVIDVPDQASLMVKSTGQKGSATITVTMVDGQGNKVVSRGYPNGITASITLTVTQSVDSALIMMTGQQEFIQASGNYGQGQTEANTYVVTNHKNDIAVYLMAQDKMLLSNIQVSAITNQPSVATITSSDNGRFVLDFMARGTVRVELSCDGADSSGNPVRFIFYVTY